MSYNTELQTNNTDLEGILASVRNLPTAGGGGSSEDWELITNETLEESVTSYEKSFSNPLKEMYIACKIVNASTATNLGFAFTNTIYAGNRQFYQSTVTANSTSYVWYHAHYFRNGYFVIGQKGTSGYAGVDDESPQSYGVSTVSGQNVNTGDTDGLTRLFMTGITFGAGTQVVIYGKR